MASNFFTPMKRHKVEFVFENTAKTLTVITGIYQYYSMFTIVINELLGVFLRVMTYIYTFSDLYLY